MSRYTAENVDDSLRRIRARRHGIAGSVNHLRRELIQLSSQAPAARQEVVEFELRVLSQTLSLLTQQPPDTRRLSQVDRELEAAMLADFDTALGLAK